MSTYGNGLWKLAPENFDNLSDHIASLNERAHHWLSGQTSWLAENYIQGKIGILVQLLATGKSDGVANHSSSPANPPAIVQKDIHFSQLLDGWGHQAMLIDVVGRYNSPEQIAHRVRSVCCAVRLNVGQNNFFEIGILPAEVVERTGFSAFSVLLSRHGAIETGFQTRRVFRERENSVLVTDISFPRQFRDKIIEGRAQISDAISDEQRNFDKDGWHQEKLFKAVAEIHLPSCGGCVVLLDTEFPCYTEVVGVLARPIKLSPSLDKPMIA